jgi:hypothetical protein
MPIHYRSAYRRWRGLPWLRTDKEHRFETDEGALRWRISSDGVRS